MGVYNAPPMRRSKDLAPWLAVLCFAAALRMPAVSSALPYSNYIDENHVLHQVVHLLAEGTWEPREYYYPTLPLYLIAGSVVAWSPLYATIHGRALRRDLSPSPPRYYDVLEPPDLIVVGRLVTLVVSLGVVALTGVLAGRLAGPGPGLFAAWLAAWVPALVARGAAVTVNPHVAFFTLAALIFAEGARAGDSPRRDATLAGVATGLAAVSKYPAVLISFAVALGVLMARTSRAERLLRLGLAGAGALAAALLCMPPLLLRFRDVVHYMKLQAGVYETLVYPSYWEQAVGRSWDLPTDHPELGIVFICLAALGAAVALREPGWRKAVAGSLLFAGCTTAFHHAYPWQPFRNLIALVPLACVLVALLYARIRRAASRPLAVDVAALAFPIVLFAPAVHGWVGHHLELEDSREQAVGWLVENTMAGDEVFVAEELVFLPSRLDALPAHVEVGLWERSATPVPSLERYRYLVLGELVSRDGSRKIPPDAWAWIRRNFAQRATFGGQATHPLPSAFRGNEQRIYLLERRERPRGPS